MAASNQLIKQPLLHLNAAGVSCALLHMQWPTFLLLSIAPISHLSCADKLVVLLTCVFLSLPELSPVLLQPYSPAFSSSPNWPDPTLSDWVNSFLIPAVSPLPYLLFIYIVYLINIILHLDSESSILSWVWPTGPDRLGLQNKIQR